MGSLPLPMERTIMFNTQVDQKTIGAVTQKILDINSDDAYLKKLYKISGQKYIAPPIEIYIDSYGGYVYQILGLVSVMEKSKTPIHTICTGAAMSCGFIMLITGHRRFAHEHSTPLYHQVSGGTIGTVKEMEEGVKETKRLQNKLEAITLEKTRITEKKLKKVYKRKKDWYITAEEALELGIVDEII